MKSIILMFINIKQHSGNEILMYIERCWERGKKFQNSEAGEWVVKKNLATGVDYLKSAAIINSFLQDSTTLLAYV
jgi:hypothetical protein